MSASFCDDAKFFPKPISAQILPPFCCVTWTVFKKRLANFVFVQNGVESVWSFTPTPKWSDRETCEGLVEQALL